MNSETLLQEFENLAERLSVTIKYGKLDGDGGLCRYREDYHIIVNKRLDPDGRLSVIARAFSQFPLDEVFLIPAIREAIDFHTEESGAKPTGDDAVFDPEIA
ncbi:MAG: hypothetical protein HN816_05740 [Gammaproteobacteria bacterium]|nr:hypothetical protein [Gammaproteobacteria bacterium]